MVFSIELSKSIKSCRIIRRRGDDMKSIIKLMVVFVCVVSLVACGICVLGCGCVFSVLAGGGVGFCGCTVGD